jgi:hypothetical protein
MPSVKFYLKKPVKNKKGAEGLSLIMASLTFNTDRIRLSTMEKINPKYWIQGRKGKKSRAINSWEFKGDEVNFRLKKIEDFLLSDYRKTINNGKQPTRESIRSGFMVYLDITL